MPLRSVLNKSLVHLHHGSSRLNFVFQEVLSMINSFDMSVTFDSGMIQWGLRLEPQDPAFAGVDFISIRLPRCLLPTSVSRTGLMVPAA